MFTEIIPAPLATKLADAINISFHDVKNVVAEIGIFPFENDTYGSRNNCCRSGNKSVTAEINTAFQTTNNVDSNLKKD